MKYTEDIKNMETEIPKKNRLNSLFWIGIVFIAASIFLSSSLSGSPAAPFILLPCIAFGVIFIVLGFTVSPDSKGRRNAWIATTFIVIIFALLFAYMNAWGSCGDGAFAKTHKIVCFTLN